jgi:hypothetical protein
VLTLMVPLAFGRVVIHDMGIRCFSDKFFVQRGRSWVARAFDDQPVFHEAISLARIIRQRQASDLLRVAARSAELNAIAKVPGDGGSIENGHLHPPYTFLPASLFTRKPWWKFW